jgi:hypothetical protein
MMTSVKQKELIDEMARITFLLQECVITQEEARIMLKAVGRKFNPNGVDLMIEALTEVEYVK